MRLIRDNIFDYTIQPGPIYVFLQRTNIQVCFFSYCFLYNWRSLYSLYSEKIKDRKINYPSQAPAFYFRVVFYNHHPCMGIFFKPSADLSISFILFALRGFFRRNIVRMFQNFRRQMHFPAFCRLRNGRRGNNILYSNYRNCKYSPCTGYFILIRNHHTKYLI